MNISILLKVFFALISLIWALYFASEGFKFELYGIALGFTFSLIVDGLVWLNAYWVFLKLYVNCIINPSKRVRLSMAYLYRIQHKGLFLLVKNSRFELTKYQPVGGVYKYFNDEVSHLFNELTLFEDSDIANDEISKFDLRLRMTKRKHLKSFLNWFFSYKNREVSPWREFYEELIEDEILTSSNFKYINYELVSQHIEPIHEDQHHNKIDTFKYVDVFKPKYINSIQKEEMTNLQNEVSDKYIWVTEDEIHAKQSKSGHLIAPHTYKILTNKNLKR